MAERARSKKTADPSDPSSGKPAGKVGKAAKSVPKDLTGELSQLLAKTLLPDLHKRAADPEVLAALTQRYNAERKAHRTADKLEDFCAHLLEQVGAAWILSCVFVRTLEDRELLRQRRLAGPGSEDSEQLFRELFPSLGKRDYLRMVFHELGRLPGAKDVLGPEKNLAWLLAPSEGAARELYDFFRRTDDDGSLRFTFGGPDTRFLGDLYQDLSASVRERFALLQTPRFVEKFILDLTLEPAVERFGLVHVRLLDPTCGSGHFLLGAFDRLFEHRQRAFPGLANKEHAATALAQIYGCDLNPYAVAIARFRLTLSFLEKAELQKLHEAPELKLNLVVADSLLYGAKGQTWDLSLQATDKESWGGELYNLEDPQAAKAVFQQGYHAIVGNPPYITCKDSELRELYRKFYRSAAGKYALAAPFTECFFQLAGAEGYVGLINANSFMKREFGRKLIEEVLPKLDVQRIVDTSGAFIPGHGTPTVLLFGQNRAPLADKISVVMGKRGEPSVPGDAEQGLVWRSIEDHFAEAEFENDYISTRSVGRAVFDRHPWSLGGGGVSALKEDIESKCKSRLDDLAEDIGFASFTGLDDLFIFPKHTPETYSLEKEFIREIIVGESVRDWNISTWESAVVPYQKDTHQSVPLARESLWHRYLWPYRACAEKVTGFGGKTRKESGENWWEWYRWQTERYKVPFRITFGEVATHNHFVLEGGGKVFNRTAPIIKLDIDSSAEEHLALLGYLNSSVACFWSRQVLCPKGGDKMGEGGRVAGAKWEDRVAFAGGAISKLPVPAQHTRVWVGRVAQWITKLARRQAAQLPSHWIPKFVGDVAELRHQVKIRTCYVAWLRMQMVAEQEELDWHIYKLFGLADTPRLSGEVAIRPEWRPFEISMAASMEHREWFQRHQRPTVHTLDNVPIPPDIKAVYQQRLDLIRSDSNLALLESPEHKRRWEPFDFGQLLHQACRAQLLTLVEALLKQGEQRPHSVRELASELSRNATACAFASYAAQESDPDFETLLRDLIPTDSVPYLAALRYTNDGMENRAKWEATWALQRREDAGEHVGDIPVPPKYDTKDFRDPIFYRLRGKLDVPKERFISYPGAEREDDRSPLLGWAGWDHLQRATALSSLYQERKTNEGWSKAQLTPLLAGIHELVPWLKQWHNEPSPEFGSERLGNYFESYVDGEARALGLTLADLVAWRPEAKGRGKGGRAKKAASEAEPAE